MENIIYISQCTSTNDEILKYMNASTPDIFTLYSFNQTQGRGQYGNVWKISPNQNLAFSMAVAADKIKISDTLFNFHTAIILRDFIAKKSGSQAKIKWPNDIILQNKKISGMLIERKKVGDRNFFIVGIGINILQENFENLPKAGSIFTQTHQQFDLKQWAEEMHFYFQERMMQEVSSEKISEKIQTNLFRKGEVSVFEIQKIRQNGIIQKVDSEGFLWVDLEKDGLRKFYYKEIELLY